MASLYQLAVLGSPSAQQVQDLEQELAQAVTSFGMKLGNEVDWEILPGNFQPDMQKSSAVAFYGSQQAPTANIHALLRREVPILPVVSTIKNVSQEIPGALRPLNCLAYDEGGAQRVASTMLECVGLLPRQRRVFISYRRDEARDVALQLFDALSARFYDVFVDTHGIPLAEDFQTMLWHRLSDSDVLIMLDTPNYFDSYWTSAEFGRALAKDISILRIGWPNHTPSSRTSTASSAQLSAGEINAATGRLTDAAVERICLQLETVRSQGLAVRSVNLVSKLRIAVEQIGGQILGAGPHRAIYVKLPDDREIIVYPNIGVPTSSALHDAATHSPTQPAAVLYDHVGLHPDWQAHLDWLGTQIKVAHWVKVNEAGWRFAVWGV